MSDENKYEAVIGLEVHAQMRTRTKIFCGCTVEFGRDPNTQTCPVCSGMPGVLPVLNAKALELSVLTGLATNCNISPFSQFARKNYFYPDLPKGYQISQYDLPICEAGWLDIEVKGETKRIGDRPGIVNHDNASVLAPYVFVPAGCVDRRCLLRPLFGRGVLRT